jgi:hypothetical protein
MIMQRQQHSHDQEKPGTLFRQRIPRTFIPNKPG